ncbi:hypothetical protein KY314_00355 [Candidatus Woesearchaeota archaeon]|nr:hypothetical protein [Candidatus Woesearchaeota archaeon]
MSSPYTKQKGANFERRIAENLTKTFRQWGYEFYRSPLQERLKQNKSGDVSLIWKTDPKEQCIMRRYHVEVEHRKSPRYINKLEKAIDDADPLIAVYVGKKTGHPEPYVMMSWKDYQLLLQELQGFIVEADIKA